MPENRQWRLVTKPRGLVSADDLTLVTEPAREPGPGEVMLRLLYISLDPGLQVFMAAPPGMTRGVVREGEVVCAWAAGRVVASRDERFPVGTYARDHAGIAGVQDYATLPASALVRVDPALAPLPAQLGVLGMPALTAYFGLLDVGRPREGETVVVSGASGAVGSVAGQIARIKGCRVVGIAGGPEKCRYLVDELRFDAGIDYKSADFRTALAAACPAGIDVYFDNVGGETLDLCLSRMAVGGRIVSCGAVAEYAAGGQPKGLRNYLQVLGRQLRWQGMNYHAYESRYEAALAELEAWLGAGKLRHREDVAVGLENFVPAFHRLFTGANLGKLVLQTSEGETA